MEPRNTKSSHFPNGPRPLRLLVMNCHEAWVSQLRWTDAELDIVVDLPGRRVHGWDRQMRPVPDKARLLRLNGVRAGHAPWDVAVCQNITDLLDLATVPVPKLLMLHESLDGRLAQQGGAVGATDMRRVLHTYLEITGAHAVGVTAAKALSWGVDAPPLHCAADPADYPPATYEKAAGIRVANHVTTKRVFLAWDFHEAAFGGLAIDLVGHNPEIGVTAATSWDDLKRRLSTARFMVHTADPRYEDGFNMAVVEGMAAGLPVISNAHPTSAITHGVDGFVADTPAAARAFAQQLLSDRDLAARMGAAARETVRRRFATSAFADGMRAACGAAIAAYRRRAAVSRGDPAPVPTAVPATHSG